MKKRTNTANWCEREKRWRIYVTKDGVKRVFYSSTPGRKGQREANAKADAWLEDNIENQNIKVKDAIQLYLEDLRDRTSEGNWRPQESLINNHIIQPIGNIKVSVLNNQHLQGVINRAYKKSNLSKKTLQNLRACLIQFVKFCRKSNFTALIPDCIDIPKGAVVSEKHILQPDDLKALFMCDNTLYYGTVQYEPYVYAWRFEAITGLRPGEIIGLMWSDIIGDTVHLQRSINRQLEITHGKNDNARRSFKLFPLLQSILQKQIEYTRSNNLESDYVFCNERGDYITPGNYYKRWCKYRDFNGIAKISPYELRHTFVSIVKALPQGVIKNLVGHSKNMDTYGVYSHALVGDMDVAADMVSEIVQNLLGDGAGFDC
ncbi:MAG: tyrosine-type recombinase/integrase [Candidatus Ornithomonoglobus sp.]